MIDRALCNTLRTFTRHGAVRGCHFLLTWTWSFANLSLRTIADARSPIIMAMACVGVEGIRGATDASATRNPAIPCTLQTKGRGR